MDFRSFWQRIILRRKGASSGVTPPPAATKSASKAPAESPGMHQISTGNIRLDHQHQEIMEAILGLQKALKQGLAGPPLLASLEALLQKMNTHFSFEEAYLERIGYSDLPHHRQEHESFRTAFHHLYDRVEAEDPGVSLDLSSFLFNWFRKHTLEEDAAFGKSRPQN
jgi:hemerythrin